MSDHLFRDSVTTELLRKAAGVRLLVLDVDGVLSDGSIIYDAEGREIKSFHVWDGFAIKLLQRFGIECAIISGRRSAVVTHRAAELGISQVHQGRLQKTPALEEILAHSALAGEQVCAIGDDLPDLPLLVRAGLSACPADGHPLVRAQVDYVAQRGGGRGAVREIAELILHARGELEECARLFPA